MKHKTVKQMTSILAIVLAAGCVITGCGQSAEQGVGAADNNTANITSDSSGTGSNGSGISSENTDTQSDGNRADVRTNSNGAGTQTDGYPVPSELEVRFGDDGDSFAMTLLDNDTAAAIAGYVGTSDWRLPIYERDDDADFSVMQYYDIPNRYDIPSDPITVTSEKAGEVYYSDPNRIVLFYRDAEVTGEYTLIGSFDPTEEFVTAVEENPMLEGWGNKIVHITQP